MRFACWFGSLLIPALAAGAETLRVPQDHATIQAAVTAAQTGDVILIAKGTYSEAVLVDGKSGITLRGKAKPSIDGQGTVTPLTIQNSQDVVVDGLVLENSLENDVILLGVSGVVIRRCTIRNTPAGGDGISASNSSDLLLEKNRFEDVGGDGIDFDDDGGLVATSVVSKNRFAQITESAIDVNGAGHRIEKNRVSGAQIGVELDDTTSGCTALKNTLVDIGEHAIRIEGSGNVAEKNKLSRLADEGISVKGPGTRVEMNKITGVGDDGIDVESDNNLILGNKVKKAGDEGIEVEADASVPGTATGNLFEANKVTGSGENGFHVTAGGNTFRQNKASKSGSFDLLDDSLSGTNVYEDNGFGTQQILP